MKNVKLAHLLVAIALGTTLVSNSVLAEESFKNKATQALDSAGQKIDDSMKSIDGYMGDSATTAKIKSELLAAKGINSSDISVKTEGRIVYISGFVKSEKQSREIIEIIAKVKGVKSIQNGLTIKK
ncbi:BON domain-containing protein [Photorhabdus noenieputensis]|uniref:BON domain-containing protein n=1 Tax=Photorhabdus TaxID=29487 RepID=UPI001BD27D76|nr:MULTISPECIES: BON domain-containing protein [Photorhabdus]MBS9424787.1 BON domain-containing protein [Photorhabdus caribbeanensis]MBS9437978.1 BON domain-containing protein [Photorhabdus noenieputensis]MCK3671293.1 BON domain-containing protein [Photorhabdus noenieputensis]